MSDPLCWKSMKDEVPHCSASIELAGSFKYEVNFPRYQIVDSTWILPFFTINPTQFPPDGLTA